MSAVLSIQSYTRRHALLVLHAREDRAGYDGAPNDESAPASLSGGPVEPESASDWTQVHGRILALRAERAGHDRQMCRWLLAAERLGVHARAGYASLREYADRTLGLGGRETEERLRVGRALPDLPVLDAALASGELCWSAVREITRVATRDTEQAWLAWAKGRRVRQIEAAVVSRHRGDGPRDRPDPSMVKHRLAFDVRAETMALFRDLQAAVRADLGADIEDDAVVYEIVRRALGGPGDDGRAGYQVAVTRCEECGRTSIDAGGLSHPVDDSVAEMIECDSQLVTRAGDELAGASPHVRAEPRSARATQTIPPATRRHVMRRDSKRCVVPGCQNHRFLDVHHLDPRSEGGDHDPERLAILCGAHHRAVHAGALRIDGTASGGLTFRHADGTPYGAPLRPPSIDSAAHVLGALENLGFKPSRARELLDAALRDGAPEDPAALLHAALRAS